MGVNQVLDLNPDSPWCHLFDSVLVTQRVTISMCKSHILWLCHVTTSSIFTSHPSLPVTATCYCDYRFWGSGYYCWQCCYVKITPEHNRFFFFFFGSSFCGSEIWEQPSWTVTSGSLSCNRNHVLAGLQSPGGSTGLDIQVSSPGTAGR